MAERNIERDRAVARAMGWANVGARWRPPGTVECASGPLASTITHSRVHRLRALPDFTEPQYWPVLIEWLRGRDGSPTVEMSVGEKSSVWLRDADADYGATTAPTPGESLCELVLAVASRREEPRA